MRAPWPGEYFTSELAVGDDWLAKGRSLLLEVPNAIVPETWNVLINPLHSKASLLKVVAKYDHALDGRLIQ